MFSRAHLILLTTVMLTACAEGLPIEERIAGLRPLAIRVEVDDPSADEQAAVRTEALPLETVRLVPFIVDPEGPLDADRVVSELEPRWLACNLGPDEGLGSCLARSGPLALEDLEVCPDVQTSTDPNAEPTVFPTPCELTTGTAFQPEFVVPFDATYLFGGDIEVTMVAHRPDEGTTDRCMEQLLAGQGTRPDAACVFVTQRVAVGPDAVLIDLAVQFGILDESSLETLPDPLPDADTHPRISTFVVREFDEAGNEVAVFEPARGQVIEVVAGHDLELETQAPEGDLQTYPIVTDDGFTDEDEAYFGLWYTTWGELLSGTSDDPLSLNTWTLTRGEQDEEDDELPPGGRATLFYVLRDGRNGVDWWWFHADVVAE